MWGRSEWEDLPLSLGLWNHIEKFVVEAKKQFDTRTIESPEDCPECMRLREALTQK